MTKQANSSLDNHEPSRRSVGGFTLIELLVVIGIIASLIAILLPVLNRTRRAAQTVACLSNLRTIGQAMTEYTTENKGWLPGSGWTSGAQFWNFSTLPPTKKTFAISNCPAINETNDWVGPLAREMVNTDIPIDGTNSVTRYDAYRNLGWMICPSYREFPVAAKSSSDGDDGSGQGLSYCATLSFLNRPRSVAGSEAQLAPLSKTYDGNLIVPLDAANSAAFIALPNGYNPQCSQIVNSCAKVFVADGARTNTPSGTPQTDQPPAYNISGNPSNTGWDATCYADYGAFGGYSHAFSRTAVPGNCTVAVSKDARLWSYRHGALTGFQSAGSYRTNAVFFDGHAETLDDVQAANPALWMPSGSVITPASAPGGSFVAGSKTVWSDVLNLYCPGVSGSQTWTSP